MTGSSLSHRYWVRYLIILLIWIVIISFAFQGSTRLNDQIESSTNIISDDTEAAAAAELYDERFNKTGATIEHIIILHLPDTTTDEITDTKWSDYTLFLSLYLFDQMGSEGYDQVVSAPLIQNELSDLPNVDDIAGELISDDEKTTMIFLSSSTLTLEENEIEVQNHVHTIRDLLSDYDGLIQFITDFANEREIPPIFLLSPIPDVSEVNQLDRILTGTPANIVDTLEVSEESFRQSEIIAAIVIIIILFIVFRTPLGVVIPLISTIAALFPAYMITSYLGDLNILVVNSFLPSVIAMIGIAVAVDYNLFIQVRYREEYRKRRAELELNDNWNEETMRQTQVESSKVMNKTAGTAVMYSGFTVVIGFAALLLSNNEFSKAMAIGVSIVVLLSIITARTMSPAILALFGRYLDWPNFTSRADKDVEEYKDSSTDHHGFWVNWSKKVMRYPFVFLLIGLLIMAPFVVLSAQTELSFSFVKSLPANTESRNGFEVIQDQFNLGEINPYQIIIDAGHENSVFTSELIATVNSFTQEILAYSGYYEPTDTDLKFSSAMSMSVLENSSSGEMMYLSLSEIEAIFTQPDQYTIPINQTHSTQQTNWLKLLYINHTKNFINWDVANNTMVIEITSNLDPGGGAAWELINVIDEIMAEYFNPLEAQDVIDGAFVTGLTASVKQSSDNLYKRIPLMLAVAVVLIFLALMVLFRSIILPIKAILTIGGSILFGLGTLVFIFQMGNLQYIEVFGQVLWEVETSGITYFLPTFLFTTILGLGMDYSIFIISRIKEEYENSGDMGESVGLGLSKTAGVVTSAATIMTLTFLVFASSPMLTLRMMGLAMAVAIIIDATIARTILLPAAMKLAGSYNFWLPEWLKKILPEIELDH